MAADLITTCLTDLTDYLEYEKLCCALLYGGGHRNIEPYGGWKDGGRDAIGRDSEGRLTCYTFSTRTDWYKKLKEDSLRVSSLWPEVKRFVYVTTSNLSAGDKDSAGSYILGGYDWNFDIYDLARLRMLIVQQPHLIETHRSIFTLKAPLPAAQGFAQRYVEANGDLFSSLARCESPRVF